MKVKMQRISVRKEKDYGQDVDMLISLVTQKGLDPFAADRKVSMLYALEAEEISIKNLEEIA